MLRHIVLWKYGIAVAVILGLSIYVSHQDQKTRDQYEQKCSQLNARSVSPAAHREDCDKGAENAARHLPRWYRVFGWPEGITAWAILLTLLTISEQTSATRKAADVSARALVVQFRPKVIVRGIQLHPQSARERKEGEPWRFQFTLQNIGGTEASVQGGAIELEWFSLPARHQLIEVSYFEGFTLRAHEKRVVEVQIEDAFPYSFHSRLNMAEVMASGGKSQRVFPACSGGFSYADENGTIRDTQIFRTYDIKLRRFIPSDDPEREYAD